MGGQPVGQAGWVTEENVPIPTTSPVSMELITGHGATGVTVVPVARLAAVLTSSLDDGDMPTEVVRVMVRPSLVSVVGVGLGVLLVELFDGCAKVCFSYMIGYAMPSGLMRRTVRAHLRIFLYCCFQHRADSAPVKCHQANYLRLIMVYSCAHTSGSNRILEIIIDIARG